MRDYPITLYFGHDEREEVGTHVFLSSVLQNTTSPIALCPLSQEILRKVWTGGHRDGTNGFIYLRFLVPYLQWHTGWAIFVDGADMLCRGDIADLWALRDPFKAVQVVPHDYKTKHPRKYVGTPMEAENRDYPRKNQSSVMLINCAHYAWRSLTPEKVAQMSGSELHRFEFIPERYIGDLPVEWNWLADEFGPNKDAKLLHFTCGVPGFPAYRDVAHADEWFEQLERVNYAVHA